MMRCLHRRVIYISLLGSRRAQAARRKGLAEAGFMEAESARLRGSQGLDLGGRQPAEIAPATMV